MLELFGLVGDVREVLVAEGEGHHGDQECEEGLELAKSVPAFGTKS